MRRGYTLLESGVIGPVALVVSEIGVEHLFLLETSFQAYQALHPEVKQDEAICETAKRQLQEYFQGERLDFQLPLAQEGTLFREKVWEALRTVPYGKTVSYKEIATCIGKPGGARAVGGAVRANTLPIIIPCHRVIGADGRMTGFMGSHTSIKEKLLAHEQQVIEKQIKGLNHKEE